MTSSQEIMVCDMPLFRSSPSLERSCMKTGPVSTFNSQLLSFYLDMNIINSIAIALHVCLPHQVWPLRSNAVGEEQRWHMWNA